MSKNNLLVELLGRKRNQGRNARLLQIDTPQSIVEYGYVKIGGIDQWITIRGEDRSNPVLLLIHGGPASTYSIFTPLLRSWEQNFTIVQWDQRGAGKTFGKNGRKNSDNLSFHLLAQDGIEVAEYLCRKLQQPKVVLVASSAGSLTGLIMAKQRPDLFHAYVGTDQNSPDPHHLSYQLALDALNAASKTKGVRLLEKMGSIPTKWSRRDFNKMNQVVVQTITDVPNMITDIMLPAMLASPDHTIKDLIDIFKGMNFSLDCLFEELLNFNFTQLGRQFDLPFFIFQGDSDIITPTQTAKAFFDQIEAPHKEFVLIKQAGHLACFARPDQCLEELIQRVRPLALPTVNLLR